MKKIMTTNINQVEYKVLFDKVNVVYKEAEENIMFKFSVNKEDKTLLIKAVKQHSKDHKEGEQYRMGKFY